MLEGVYWLWGLLSLWWGRFCHWITKFMYIIPKSDDRIHKVAFIGDGIAEGVGDYWTIGSLSGIAGRVAKHLASKKEMRQRWYFGNCGFYGSRTEDWREKGVHLEAFLEGPFGDAEIVCILFGSEEFGKTDDSSKIFNNLASACTALVERGKVVFLCTILAVPGARNIDDLVACNARIEKFQKDPNGVSAGLPLHLARFSSEENIVSGFPFFNRHGYRLVAGEFATHLVSAIRQVEWKTWKTVLRKKPGQ
eukprot:Rmarinus@m.3067